MLRVFKRLTWKLKTKNQRPGRNFPRLASQSQGMLKASEWWLYQKTKWPHLNRAALTSSPCWIKRKRSLGSTPTSMAWKMVGSFGNGAPGGVSTAVELLTFPAGAKDFPLDFAFLPMVARVRQSNWIRSIQFRLFSWNVQKKCVKLLIVQKLLSLVYHYQITVWMYFVNA